MNRRTFALAATACAVASTAARAAPTGVDEGLFVPINGMEQWITVRGRDLRNPVLLFLHGGPGVASSGNAPVFAAWEEHFTVVQWDQPGGGATHAKNLTTDTGPFTPERYYADAVAVAEWTRKRLGAKKLVVMGASWGSVLGVMLAQKRPDMVSAYVGAGQVVSRARGDLMGYEMALAGARARGSTVAVTALEKVGPPPYPTLEQWFVRQQYTNPPSLPMSQAEIAATAEAGRLMRAADPAKATWIARGVPTYDIGAQFFAIQKATYAVRSDRADPIAFGTRFKVPVFIVQGENDLNTPTPLAREYFDQIRAPAKGWAVIPGASHNVVLFSPQVLAFLVREVRPVVNRRT